MTTCLIVTTYNWTQALNQVLLSVKRQTLMPDEIIIADDGSKKETKELVEAFIRKNPQINFIHSWQEDKGFRLTNSRNKAIAMSKSKYIIIVDGDIILNKNFIKDHIRFSKQGYFIQGTRVLLGQNITNYIFRTSKFLISFFSKDIKNRKNLINSTILSKFFSRQTKSLRGIRGCNISFFKKDCIDVNGFNEDFEGWGREDSEFVVRLFNKGIKRKNLKFKANALHLYHEENSRKMLTKNDEILKSTIDNRLSWCKNGINKY